MKAQKTYIFFPIEIGLAHILRSYSVADELSKRGHRAIFAIPKRKHYLFQAGGNVELVDIDSYIEDDFKVKMSAFREKEFVRRMLDLEIALIRKYHPVAVIVDFRLTALAASEICGVKTFSITNGDALPHGSYLPNPGFHPILFRLGMPLIQKVFDLGTRLFLRPLLVALHERKPDITQDQWFRKVEYIVPEPKNYFAPCASDLTIHYVGPLFWNQFDSPIPSWLSNINRDGKTIYLTFGGTGFDKQKLRDLAYKLVESGYRVVVTTGSICDPKDIEARDNLFVAKFLPGDKVSQKVDLVVCHGGYGTMTDAVKAGIPMLAIPFNPDQILHATRMEELGVGKCLLKINIIDVIKIFTLDWKWIENKGKEIPIETVVAGAGRMLANVEAYKVSINKFNKEYPSESGASEAVNIIELSS